MMVRNSRARLKEVSILRALQDGDRETYGSTVNYADGCRVGKRAE